MNHGQQMLDSHPRPGTMDRAALAECIQACFDCAQTCRRCEEACNRLLQAA